jgi:serine/threonine protein kinase
MSSSIDADLRARLTRAVAPAYEIEQEIGRGGMGIVYRARDPRLKRSVAVKLLPPDLAFRADVRSRFLREAETAARLSHPNIVPIYAVDERDGLVYFVMALVEGESVGDRLKRTGAFPVTEARRILREVAEALAYAHARGVVHRDIKPDNLLLDSYSGRAMVTDFGIARAAVEGDSRLTATGTALGTAAYMSPEQCAADRELDGRSDLYSLGAVAYHMLTGQPPFTGGNTPSIMMKQVTERAVPVGQRRAGVPDDLQRIVMRLLEKDPVNRFADGAALVAALDGAPVTPMVASEKVRESLDRQHGRALSRRERKEARKQLREEAEEARPLPDRIRKFRRHFASAAGTTLFLFGINAATGGFHHNFWWAIFPALGMAMGLVREGGQLWAAGARFREVFSGSAPSLPPAEPPPPALKDDVPSGSHRDALRQAADDRRTVHDLVGRLSDAERKLLPDILGTADALFDRMRALATALHRLDGEVGPGRLAALDERIRRIEQSSEGEAERARRLTLLQRQRQMLADLVRSRDTLLEQFESAGLLLQNLSLDLLKVRSSGLKSALEGVTSVTQEAKALSREIGYVLDAADELRELEGRPGQGDPATS